MFFFSFSRACLADCSSASCALYVFVDYLSVGSFSSGSGGGTHAGAREGGEQFSVPQSDCVDRKGIKQPPIPQYDSISTTSREHWDQSGDSRKSGGWFTDVYATNA
jgi:hypothetical protein